MKDKKSKKTKKAKKTKNGHIEMEFGKVATDGYNTYQQIRIAQNNRLRDVVRRKVENIPYEKPEGKKEKKDFKKKFEDKNIRKYWQQLFNEGKINATEFRYMNKLFEIADDTGKTEKRYKTLMGNYIKQEKLWTMWLEKVRGISNVLGSKLIDNFGYCENYEHVSSLWRHTGFDPDGAKGRIEGQRIAYNPKLKTFIWNVGKSFIMQRTPVYRRIYDEEKARQVGLMERCRCKHCGGLPTDHKRSKDKYKDSFYHCKDGAKYDPTILEAPMALGHAQARASRKMVKIFLQHYYLIARMIKGLHVSKPYPHDKMGHKHFIAPPFSPFKREDFFK